MSKTTKENTKRKIKALALFSGGLDSILAARIIAEQGIDVEAVQFVTPFFHYDILQDPERYKEEVFCKYGLTLHIEDISEQYLQLLHNPANGFGKHFNPCIDCKIMMIQRAKTLLAKRNASFLISGEVLGQRPMSQRRDTLNRISRDSEIRTQLIRPLCARLLEESEPEIQGWVDRSRLYDISGRGRAQQIALAKKFGISDYPAPAGGCTLTDPILSKRIKALYNGDWATGQDAISQETICTLLVGRQLQLPGNDSNGHWLIIGRDEEENKRVETLAQEGDALLFMEEWAGPTALLKRNSTASLCSADEYFTIEELRLAASLVVRYGKKIPPYERQWREVLCFWNGERYSFKVEGYAGNDFLQWILN